MTNYEKFLIGVGVVAVIAWLGMVYATIHFLLKFW